MPSVLRNAPVGSIRASDVLRNALVAIMTLLVLTLAGSTAQAILPNTPDPDAWVVNGTVSAIARDDNTIYLGGSFSSVGPNTGTFATLALPNEVPSAPYAEVNGTVWAVIPDGAGGWYIGGDFSLVGSIARSRIARIQPNGMVDPNFDPNANSTVRALALDGSTLYVCGDFSIIGGATRNRLAAVDTTTGAAIIGFDPNASGAVHALALSGSTLYAGGEFASIGLDPRNNIAAIDTATGAATAWNPNADAIVRVLLVDGSTVYVGGDFTNIGGLGRNRIAALDTAMDTNNATAWNPNANDQVFSFALSGTTLYVGGQFTNIGGAGRLRLAALDTTINTNMATGWNPGSTGFIAAIVVTGNSVIVGGNFATAIGGAPRSRIAEIDATTGLATAWDPIATATVRALALQGTELGVGGQFNSVGGVARNNIAAIDAETGIPTSFDPNANNEVRVLVLDGATLYAGGLFTNIGGQNRGRVAALDTATGLATGWNPNATGSVTGAGGPLVNDIALAHGLVYVGGAFTTIGGQTRRSLAAIDPTTGNATAWHPGSGHTGGAPGQQFRLVNTIAISGTTVYIGGQFANVGGASRSNIAAINSAVNTNNATAWNPNSNGVVNTLMTDGTTLYAGGVFTTIGGQTRNRIAALDTTVNTNNTTAWNPDASDAVNDLSQFGSRVYAAGAFATIGGETRNRIAELSKTTGLATAWNPNADNTANAILFYEDDTVSVGGQFLTIGAVPRQAFAHFNVIRPSVVIASIPSLTNQTFFPGVSVTFDMPVTGLTTGLFATSGIAVSNLQGSGANYTIDLTLTGADGLKSIHLPASSVVDADGIGNSASNTVSTTLDTAPPVPTIGAVSTPTNNNTILGVSVTFDKVITGLNVGHFTTSGVTISNLQGSGTSYTIDLTLTGGDGTKTVQLPAGVVADGLGNLSAASNVRSIVYDTTSPTPTIASVSSPTNQSFFAGVSVTFDESVVGLTEDSFTTNGIVVTNLIGSGDTYTIDITLVGGDGTKSIQLPAGAVLDLASNASLASNIVTIELETVQPEPTIAGLPLVTDVTFLPGVTVTFTKDIVSLSVDDFTTSGIEVTNLAGSGDSYTIDVTITGGNGIKTLQLPAGVVADSIGNLNVASNLVTIDFNDDPTMPTIAALPTPTNQSFFAGVSVTFDKAIVGLTEDSFTTSGIVVSNLQGSGDSYTVDLTLVGGDGAKSIQLLAGAVSSLGSIPSADSNLVEVVLDTEAPTVTIAAVSSPTNQSFFPGVSVTFSEDIASLAADDFTTNGVIVSNLQGSGDSYTIDLTLTGSDGIKTVQLPDGVVVDDASNGNIASNIVSIELDSTGPTPTIAAIPSPTNQTFFSGVAVTFDEAILSLSADDFTTNGVIVSNVQGSGDSFTIDVTLVGGDGSKSLQLDAAAVADLLGNPSLASNVVSMELDTDPPTVVIASVPSPTNQSFFAGVDVTFSKDIASLTADDFTTNGVVVSNVQGSGANYTIDITLVGGDGTKSLQLDAGAVTDLASNGNIASNVVTIDLDATQPVPTIAALPVATNQTSFLGVDVTFNKAIVSLSADDFTTNGVVVSNVQGGGDTFTIDITLVGGDGSKSLQLLAGAVADSVGNLSEASNLVETLLDTVAPTSLATADRLTKVEDDITGTYSEDDLGGSAIDTVTLYVKEPNGVWTSAGVVTGGVWTYTPSQVDATANGTYEFATVAVDLAGNAEAAPAGNAPGQGYTIYNHLENGAFDVHYTTNGNGIFPMTDDLTVELFVTDVVTSFTLTVSRVEGDLSPSAGYGAEKLLNEHLVISGDLNGAEATLTWPFDIDNDELLVPFGTVFQFDNDVLVNAHPVPAGVNPIIVNDITSFSTWWAGNNDATVSDWFVLGP